MLVLLKNNDLGVPDRILDRAEKMLDFFNWCLNHGDEMANNLHYVPMPDSVVKLVQDTWKKEIKAKGNLVWNK